MCWKAPLLDAKFSWRRWLGRSVVAGWNSKTVSKNKNEGKVLFIFPIIHHALGIVVHQVILLPGVHDEFDGCRHLESHFHLLRRTNHSLSPSIQDAFRLASFFMAVNLSLSFCTCHCLNTWHQVTKNTWTVRKNNKNTWHLNRPSLVTSARFLNGKIRFVADEHVRHFCSSIINFFFGIFSQSLLLKLSRIITKGRFGLFFSFLLLLGVFFLRFKAQAMKKSQLMLLIISLNSVRLIEVLLILMMA